ncbi:MAG: hypothetical protein QXU64_03260, partial [Thermofilaceae archaeon]
SHYQKKETPKNYLTRATREKGGGTTDRVFRSLAYALTAVVVCTIAAMIDPILFLIALLVSIVLAPILGYYLG